MPPWSSSLGRAAPCVGLSLAPSLPLLSSLPLSPRPSRSKGGFLVKRACQDSHLRGNTSSNHEHRQNSAWRRSTQGGGDEGPGEVISSRSAPDVAMSSQGELNARPPWVGMCWNVLSTFCWIGHWPPGSTLGGRVSSIIPLVVARGGSADRKGASLRTCSSYARDPSQGGGGGG